MWVFLCQVIQVISLPGYPGKVSPGKTAASGCPGKVSLAATAALTSEKKLKYFLPMCCDLVKMYYLCTSNKSNNLNF
jgi:hypothetical protein